MNILMRKFMAALSLFATASLIAVSGYGQTASTTTKPEEKVTLEKFEVTGSRLHPPDFEAALPVNMYSAATDEPTMRGRK